MPLIDVRLFTGSRKGCSNDVVPRLQTDSQPLLLIINFNEPLTPQALRHGIHQELTAAFRVDGVLNAEYIHPARWNDDRRRWELYLSEEAIDIPPQRVLSAIVVTDVAVIGTIGQGSGVHSEKVSLEGVNTLIHLMAQLHSLCGPLTGEATDGCSQVVTVLLSPTLASVCQELSGLPKAIVYAAGGHSDNAVEVDDLLGLVLDAWLAQQAADQRQFEALSKLVDVHGRGLTLQDVFVGLVKQVNAGVAAALSPEQFNTLFISALRASGPGTVAINAAGCAAALMGAGLIGCAAHLCNHPAVTSKPPFSEYRLLEDSWHAIKPAMQELLRTLPRRSPQLAPEVSAMTAQIKKLDDSLEGCAPAAELWQCYGKILGFYSHHGKFVEVTPAATGSLTADTVCNSPRGPAAAATTEDVSSGGTESTAGAVTGYQANLLSSSSSSRPSSPLGQLTPLPLASVGARSPGMPASPRLLAVAVGSRPGSADSAVASAATSVPCSPVHTVAVPIAAPGSRPGSAGGPGLKLPLAAALVRPGSALSRPGLSPRGSASSLSGLRSK